MQYIGSEEFEKLKPTNGRQEEDLKVQYDSHCRVMPTWLKRKRDEVVTLPSGLQYEVIKEEGAVPASTDQAKVHYHGTL